MGGKLPLFRVRKAMMGGRRSRKAMGGGAPAAIQTAGGLPVRAAP